MDPPEFRTSRSRANPLGLRPESKAYDQIGEDLGGPIATAFGYQRPYLRKGEDYPQKLSIETPQQRRAGSKRQTLAGRAARAGDVPNSKRMRSVFPSEPPGAEVGSKPRGVFTPLEK